ncbi:MAG: hypothetical protein KatS3mg077_2965 [Candidatus Binatia bacterium]|nr:MAG: hypothetical protein KatS3mg077_2965 [Candidatus Binatia bacterium]
MNLRHLRNARGFLSDYYLGSVFGRRGSRGRKAATDRTVDIALARFCRIRERAEGRAENATATRESFIRPLLRDVLGFHLGAGEDRIHALFPSAEAEERGKPPLLFAYCGSWDEDLDGGRGRANPMQRLGEHLARHALTYGLLVTGERLRLVRAPGEGPRGAYLEADLAALAEDEDPDAFAAFLSLFSASNFTPDEDGHASIEAIERESREHAERVSEDLKGAVFRAAESLVSGLIADAVARGAIRSPLELGEASIRDFRDAALLGLYRLLFILYAEARDPRLDEHKLYRESYSATGLLEEVLRDSARQWPENRCFLWERLRALFRIYDEGLPAVTPWEHIPPRGGDFFSRATPAGRILDEARLPDREVARLILDLATTQPRRGVGRERVSFRELDIENLGAVYEGLLEFEPRIARETLIEVRVQGREYVLPPGELGRLCEKNNLTLKGEVALVAGTAAELHHPGAPNEDADEAENAINAINAIEDDKLEATPDDEESGAEEGEGLEKGATARLLRRLEPGAFHFVPGPARKGSGSFYTPRPLVQDLVRHALGPLIEGKRAAEIERLRILDPACGSAHFLVEAMRFLGQALHHAYVKEYGGKAPLEFRTTTGQGWDDHWQASDEEARAANSEARAWCKRRIAERCLFGVDLNPTAVQLAQVALWIESLAGDRPLTYFQHHIRCGNSLLGSWMARLEQPPLPSKRNKNPQQGFLPFQNKVREAIREAARLRRLIDTVRPEDLLREGIQPESTEEQRYKEHLRRKAEETLQAARLLFDVRSASAFIPEIWREWETLTRLIHDPARLHAYAEGRPWWPEFERVRERERFFHWELEFPEVFLDEESPGFDAVLGNPPWDKIKPDRKEFYGRYDILIRAFVGGELDRRIRELHSEVPGLAQAFEDYEERVKTLAACLKKGGDYQFQDWKVDGKTTGGDPDAFKFFVERGWQLVRQGGRVGFVAPSAVYNNEGCTGLRHLLLEHSTVERFYAFENRKKIFPIDSRYKFVSLVFRREARGERREGGIDEQDNGLQRSQGLATEHAVGEIRLRSDQKPSGERTMGLGFADASSGGFDTVEHCGGLWSAGERRVPPSSIDGEGLSAGTGDRTAHLQRPGVSHSAKAGTSASGNKRTQSDVGNPDRETPLTPNASRLAPDASFQAAFMRHDLAELNATARYRELGQEKVKPFSAPWMVPIRRQELERLSPGTLAFLEYRTPRDREILLKMYGYDADGNPVNPRPLLGDQGPGTWNARFYREFDMTNDRDLWTDPKTGKLCNPRQVLGPVPGTTDRPPYYDPAAWPEIRKRMAEKGFWPLYEGKHIEQFLVDIKPIERWVSLEACEKKYGKPPDPGPKLVFRDIASNTNERTCIAAVLPEGSCAGNTLACIISDSAPPDVNGDHS